MSNFPTPPGLYERATLYLRGKGVTVKIQADYRDIAKLVARQLGKTPAKNDQHRHSMVRAFVESCGRSEQTMLVPFKPLVLQGAYGGVAARCAEVQAYPSVVGGEGA